MWRIHTNEDLLDLNRAADTILEIMKGRLGMVRIRERVPDKRTMKDVFNPYPANVENRVSS